LRKTLSDPQQVSKLLNSSLRDEGEINVESTLEQDATFHFISRRRPFEKGDPGIADVFQPIGL